jgi:hypothetical protein
VTTWEALIQNVRFLEPQSAVQGRVLPIAVVQGRGEVRALRGTARGQQGTFDAKLKITNILMRRLKFKSLALAIGGCSLGIFGIKSGALCELHCIDC